MPSSFFARILRIFPRRKMHSQLNRQFSSRILSCLSTFLPAAARPHPPPSLPPSAKSPTDESFVHVEHPPSEEEEQQQEEQEQPEEDPNANRELVRREVFDSLDTVVCSEQVKRQLKSIAQWVQICRRHGEDPRKDWYNMVFQGNPGTGTVRSTSIIRSVY